MRVKRDEIELDSAELRERCLHCTHPPEVCFGEERCIADLRMKNRATKAAIIYGRRRGETLQQIADEMFVSKQYVSFVLRTAK